MIITEEIVDACRKAVLKSGSQSELSRISGVSQQSISQICSVARTRNNISRPTFLRLFPFLKKFLPESMVREYSSSVPEEDHGDFSPAVQAVLSASISAAEKAKIIKHLYGADNITAHPRQTVEELYVINCPRCHYDMIIPPHSEKVSCPECGQHLKFASLIQRSTEKTVKPKKAIRKPRRKKCAAPSM